MFTSFKDHYKFVLNIKDIFEKKISRSWSEIDFYLTQILKID